MSHFTTVLSRLAMPLVLAAAAATAGAQAAPQLLPYNVSLVAGGAASNPAAGSVCASGKTSLDAFGDGCLATEVVLNAPAYVTSDSSGNVFFSDTLNALVRRVDAATGIITVVAGGAAANPASGTTCGAFTSTDILGDGCLATSVKLSKPQGLAFSPTTGELYIVDSGNDTVRKIASGSGVITIQAGSTTNTFGYNVNTVAGGNVTAANNPSSYLNFPFGIAFDSKGNFYIADEGNNAVEGVNTGSTTVTMLGVSVPPGTIAKLAGFGDKVTKNATIECTNFISTAARGGCYFAKFTDGNPAVTSNLDNPYAVALDAAGNLYIANEFNQLVAKISTTGIITDYAGIQGSQGTTNKRGTANAVAIGGNFGVAVDGLGNLYTSDSKNGWIWRVDAANQGIYVFAGAAASVCAGASDAVGDGCPANQAKFSVGTLNGSGFATAAGVDGLAVDPAGNLLVADIVTSLIRKISTGQQFGTITPAQPTQNIDVHFGVGDSPAANAYTFTTGATSFTVGTPTCATNTDTTTDCIVPIRANPTAGGPFSGNLHIVSTLGKTADYLFTGNLSLSQANSTTAVTLSTGTTNPGSPVTISVTVSAASGTPSGTVTFFSGGTTQLGTTQTLVAGKASITASFPVGTYSITAVYSGDLFYFGSTSQPVTLISANPGVTVTPGSTSLTVKQGQYGLTSFVVTAVNGYSGTVTFACSGLPANTTCAFTPTPVTVPVSSTVNSATVALSIITQSPGLTSMNTGSRLSTVAFAGIPGVVLLLLITGKRRRMRLPLRLLLVLISASVAIGFAGCSSGTASNGTPIGTSTITVTATATPNNLSPNNIVNTSTITLTVTP